ncbi:MAG: hypothetical protein SVS85_02960, partial [Candidatus Nanohaloarchaea archaeon]|nr:hypothetical protein [Candidatus Nanohaloarchaea archaeon]
TRPVFIFQVPGEPRRDGRIETLAGTRENGKARIDVLFRNTGSVTVEARVSALQIYNGTGYHMKTLRGPYRKVPPGQTRIFKNYWLDENRDESKKRRVEATIDYKTGVVEKEAMVTIPKRRVQKPSASEREARTGFPMWLAVLVIGVAAVGAYYRWF